MEKLIFSKQFRNQLSKAGYYIDDLEQAASGVTKSMQLAQRWTELPNKIIQQGLYSPEKEEVVPRIQLAIEKILSPWLKNRLTQQEITLPSIQALEIARQTNLSSEKICKLIKKYPIIISYNKQEQLAIVSSSLPPTVEPMTKDKSRLNIKNASEYRTNPKRILKNARQKKWRSGSCSIQSAKLQWSRVDMLIRKEAANKATIKFNNLTANTESQQGNSKKSGPYISINRSEDLQKTNFLLDYLLDNSFYQQNNKLNNDLLKTVTSSALQTGELTLWRFVCMPEISIGIDRKKFQRWQYTFGDRRYDTLTPALSKDRQLIAQLQDRGINSKLCYVLDDWEAPYLRTSTEFLRLPKKEQNIALAQLKYLRQDMTSWINNTSQEYGVTAQDNFYFSSRIGYQEFVDLIDAIPLELDPQYSGIYQEELRFVKKSSPQLSLIEQNLKAAKRIAQYAVEGSIIEASNLKNGIYLNSEYPTQQVWRKLTFLAPNIPTLFYVKDGEVINI